MRQALFCGSVVLACSVAAGESFSSFLFQRTGRLASGQGAGDERLLVRASAKAKGNGFVTVLVHAQATAAAQMEGGAEQWSRAPLAEAYLQCGGLACECKRTLPSRLARVASKKWRLTTGGEEEEEENDDEKRDELWKCETTPRSISLPLIFSLLRPSCALVH